MDEPRLNGRGVYALPPETPIEVVAQQAYDTLRSTGDTWEDFDRVNTWYRTLTKRLEPGHRLSEEVAESYRTEVALGVAALFGKKNLISKREFGSDELEALSRELQRAIQARDRISAVDTALVLAESLQGIDYIMQGLEQIRKSR